MIIDFHTHIFPRSIRENRSAYFKEEPAFKLLYDSPKSKIVGANDLIHAMDAEGVDKSVIFGFPWCHEATYKTHNDYIMGAVNRYPTRMIGFGCYDPLSEGAATETARCLDNGLAGIGELGYYNSGIDTTCVEKLNEIMAICRNRNAPVMIHTNESVGHDYSGKTPVTLDQIDALVATYPENNLVLAHWGGGLFFYTLLKKVMKKRLAKVYFDTAASPFLYDHSIYRVAADIIGADKIIFGTDYPLLGPSRYFTEMKKAGLTFDEQKAICGDNALKLLNLVNDLDTSKRVSS